ncbi:MAG: hypothetical protein M1839_006816 [Geoglossum umbratile]|nr:MAG: hypothetical protein M1839_006816 [Geoglossum umbratile]
MHSNRLSIVFIHGLGGHPRRTWTYKATAGSPTGILAAQGESQRSGLKKFFPYEKKSKTKEEFDTGGVFWPADILPEDCPDVRIITWGYDSRISNFFGGPANKNHIFTHAKDMLYALGRERSDCQKRCLIFVAHSLGGIIIKEAKRDTTLLDIYTSTVAVLFLGTPHRGSSQWTNLAKTISHVVAVAGFDTGDQNVRALQIDSAVLEVCHEGFMKVYEQSRIEIRTFQEAQGMSGLGLFGFNGKVVDNVSSTLSGAPRERTETINANHMSMCRFSSRYDDGYRKVGQELRTLVNIKRKRLQEKQKLGKEGHAEPLRRGDLNLAILTPMEQECLQSLFYWEMDFRLDAIPRAVAETCTSLFKHQNYSTWLRQHGLLWIKGKPCSGKSALMKFAFRETKKWASHEGPVVAAFFFHGQGFGLQKTSLGLFRSLLYQLLTQDRPLRSQFLSIYETKRNMQGKQNKDWDWRVEELQDFFSSSIVQAAKLRPIRIFVDALDECVELDEQEKWVTSNLMLFFKDIASRADHAKSPLSICFSSRHYPIIPSEDILEVCLEDENWPDISSFVRANLQSYSGVSEALEEDIVNRASGIFLWADLATQQVLELHASGKYSLANIAKKLQDADKGLLGVYKQILKKLGDDNNYRLKTLHLMQWVCLAERPLSLAELRIAMASDAGPPYTSQQSWQDSDEYVENDLQMERLVKFLSGGLVEVKRQNREHVVQVIHQSVKHYFMQDGIKFLDDSSTGSAVGRGHHRLSRSCINYSTTEEVCNNNLADWDDVTHRFPFIIYATAFSFLHAEKAESEGYSQEDLITQFQWPSRDVFQCWVNAHRLIHPHSRRCSGRETSLLHIVSEYNLPGLVRLLVDRGAEIQAKDECKRTALHGAAWNGHKEVVQLLVDRGAEVNVEDECKRTALHGAACNGHKEVVQLLVEKGARVNLRDEHGETVLQGEWV